MKRDLRLFIEDILEHINLIENSTKNLSKSGFESDKLVIDATIRRLEIIGEAVKNIPASFRDRYPKIPWRDIAGFRDVVIHTYFGVVLERVWRIIQKDLPDLKKEIEKIRQELKDLEKKKSKKEKTKENKKELKQNKEETQQKK